MPNRFSIEHLGILVSQPLAMAEWYNKVVGFHTMFSKGNEEKAVAFLKVDSTGTMLELIKLPEIDSTASRLNHHLQFHIALKSEDPDSDAKYLMENGATLIEVCPVTLDGDYLIVLHDPWGNCIQLAKRGRNRFAEQIT
jgi:catechol-2,3-dioxygenase